MSPFTCWIRTWESLQAPGCSSRTAPSESRSLWTHLLALVAEGSKIFYLVSYLFSFSFIKCSCLFKTSINYVQYSNWRKYFVFFWPHLSPYIIVTILSGKDLWMLRWNHTLSCVLMWQEPLETSLSHTPFVFSAHLLYLPGLSDATLQDLSLPFIHYMELGLKLIFS